MISLNVVCEISCWQQRQRFELHETHVPVLWSFLVCFRILPILKAIMGRMLKVFPQLWFVSNMCQCLDRIPFRFGNSRLYVTENGIHVLSLCFCWWSGCFQSNWSTFWICCMVTSFLRLSSTNFSLIFQ